MLGYVFVRLGCEGAPFLLGLVLGPQMEEYFRRAMLLSRGDPMVFIQRPISLGLLIATALLLILMALPSIKKARQEAFQEERLTPEGGATDVRPAQARAIAEEGPREGFQSEKKMIPVADKVRLIEALADTGLRHIACVSYVNPKRVPTMADAEEVAQAIRRKPGIEYAALWLNQQGLERALRGPLHVDGGVRVTASDTFSNKNIGKSVSDALVEQRLSLQDLQGPRHAGRMGHHPRRLRLQLRGRALDRADPAARAAGARRGRAGRLHAQGHQAHRRHGLGDAGVGRSPDRRDPQQVARARDLAASA